MSGIKLYIPFYQRMEDLFYWKYTGIEKFFRTGKCHLYLYNSSTRTHPFRENIFDQ